jgi:DNA-binding CsgD family transcriptional regulator
MAHLMEFGYATQAEIARVYGCSERTVRRLKRLVERERNPPLARRSGWPKGQRRLPVERQQRIERLKAEGLSNREVARQLEVSEHAIRKQVGPTRGQPVQLSLPGTEPVLPAAVSPRATRPSHWAETSPACASSSAAR